MKAQTYIIKLFCWALLLFPAPLWGAEALSPASLPGLIQQGIDNTDSALVMPHLDLESIVGAVIRESLPQINEQVKSGQLILNPPLAIALSTLNSGNGIATDMALYFLKDELAKFIIYGIDSGSFAGSPLPENQRMQMDGGIFSNLGAVSTAQKSFSGTSILHEDGESARIRTSLFDAGTRTSYPLELDLQKTDTLWKVTRIANLEDLSGALLRKPKARQSP